MGWMQYSLALESTVSASIGSGIIGNYSSLFAGGNWPVYTHPKETTSQLIRQQIKAAGIKTLRFPGGNPANEYIWSNNYTFFSDPSLRHWNQSWCTTLEQFIALCKDTGVTPLLQVNYAVSVLYGAQAAAELAADWVQYMKDVNLPVTYWEVGNENYGKWEFPYNYNNSKFNSALNGSMYAKNFKIIRDAMRAVDSSIQVGAVTMINGGDQIDNWQKDATAAGISENADWLSIHQYYFPEVSYPPPDYHPKWNGIPKDSDLQKQTTFVKSIVNTTRDLLGGKDIPILISEFQMTGGCAKGAIPLEENELINGLFLADHTAGAVASGITGLQVFSLTNGQSTVDDDGCGGGDFGILNGEGEVHAGYFNIYLYNKVFGASMLVSTVSPVDAQLQVYGSRRADGSLGVIITNWEDSPIVTNLTLDISDVFSQGNIDVSTYELTSANLTARAPLRTTQFKWNGVASTNSTAEGGPFPIDNIPPQKHTYTLESGKFTIQIKGASLTGIIIQHHS